MDLINPPTINKHKGHKKRGRINKIVFKHNQMQLNVVSYKETFIYLKNKIKIYRSSGHRKINLLILNKFYRFLKTSIFQRKLFMIYTNNRHPNIFGIIPTFELKISCREEKLVQIDDVGDCVRVSN